MLRVTKTLQPEEYLELEMHAKGRSELVGGVMHAMAGSSREHNFITGNVYLQFRQLKSGYRVYRYGRKAPAFRHGDISPPHHGGG
jgi:hypothetical protein